MKTKLLLSGIALFVFAIQVRGTVTHCCPPDNLAVSATLGSPAHLTFSWTHSYQPPSCAPITGFEVKVHVQGGGSNSNIELYSDDGSDPLSVQLDIPLGASISWKVRSVYGGLNGLYHNGRDGGFLSSSWVSGPDLNGGGNRTESWEDDFDFNAMLVFPNPVSNNNLKVKINSADETPATLEIFNGTGKLVKQEKFLLYSGSNLAAFDVPELHSGIYFVRISGGDKVHTVKFMIP